MSDLSDLSDLLGALVAHAINAHGPETAARLRRAQDAGADVLVRRSPTGFLTLVVRSSAGDVIVLHTALSTEVEMTSPTAEYSAPDRPRYDA